MNTNEFAADDSWSSLAQELGLGDEPAAPAPLAAIEPHLAELPDADDVEDTALEPGLSAESTSESEELGGDGKRRRRRRRRRRKGGPAEAGETGVDEAESDDAGLDDAPAEGETPADIAMRDVVANWNVPTWDELIGGLYRPGH